MSHDHEQTVLESIFCIKAYRESNHKDESRDNITTFRVATLLSMLTTDTRNTKEP